MSKEIKITDLVDKVQSYYPAADVELIRKAYDFSAKVHQGQKRLSGEPYLIHPIAVAGVIADLKMDVPSVIGGLLHDTVEDTLTTLEELKSIFGREIASLVDGVTKLSRTNFSSREEKQAENFRKMLLAMGKDVRVILIKLASKDDRVLGFLASTGDRDLLTVETSRGAEQTISTTKYEVTGRGGKGRELLQRGQFIRVLPPVPEAPTPLSE